MVKKVKDVIVKKDSFYVSKDFSIFLNKYKAKINKMKYRGFDLAILSAALAKAMNMEILDLSTKVKLFGEEQFRNHPNIDLVFQIITYSYYLNKYKDNNEELNKIHLKILDKNEIRSLGEKFNYMGWHFIRDIITDADFTQDEFNSLLFKKIKEIIDEDNKSE